MESGYELKDVIEALKNAEASGNTKDATRLADIADRLMTTSAPEQQPSLSKQTDTKDNLEGFRQFYGGVSNILGTPADILGAGLNLIPGLDTSDPLGGSESIRRGMSLLGMATPLPGKEQPTTVGGQIGRAIGETIPSAIPVLGGIKWLAKGGGLVGSIAKTSLNAIKAHPFMAGMSEISGAAGVGVGRYLGEEYYPDNPMVKGTVEIVGGVAGGAAPVLKSALSPVNLAIRKGTPLVRKILFPFTKAGAEIRASKFIKGTMADPIAASGELAKESISDIPAVVKTGEKKLIALYKDLVSKNPITEAESIDKINSSIAKINTELRKFGYGSPEILKEATEKRITSIEMKIDKRIIDAMEKAQTKIDVLPVAERISAESKIIRSELQTVMKKEKALEQIEWSKVDKNYPVKVANTNQKIIDITEGLAEAQLDDIPSVIKSSSFLRKDDVTSTKLKELQGLRSSLLETARRARSEYKWNKARISEEIADSILEDIGISSELISSPEANQLKIALASTAKFKNAFERGVPGKILGFSKTGAPSIDPTLTIDLTIKQKGVKGIVDINKILVTPEAENAAKRYLGKSFIDYAQNESTGIVDPKKVNMWVKNNEEILDQFPDIRTKIQDIGTAQRYADETKILLETRKAKLRNPKISVAGKFLEIPVEKEIDGLFKTKDPSTVMRQIMRQSRKDQTGDAQEGIRSAVINYMIEKSSYGKFNDLGEKTLSGRGMLSFLNKNYSTMKEVFSPEQLSRLNRIARESIKIEVYEETKPLLFEKELFNADPVSKISILMGRIFGARLGGYMGKQSAGGSLQMAQIYSKEAQQLVKFLNTDRATKLLNDAILEDSGVLLDALIKSNVSKPYKSKIQDLKILNNRLNLWMVGSGKSVVEDIKEDFKKDKKEQ